MIRKLISLLQIVYTIYALSVFVLIMLLVFPFVLLSLIFGVVKGGNLIYLLCKIWARTWYFLVGIQHKNIYEAPYDTSRQYIFVANHVSYLDIPPAVLAVQQPCRVLGKYEMIKYPVFGLIYKAAVILVDRRNAEARAKSVRALKSALKKGISIFIFPEGTFNESPQPLKSFFDGAFKLAIESQTPIKPLLFIDTLDRLHYRSIFAASPGPNRVVFLETIEVAGLEMKDMEVLKEKVYWAMDAGLRRYRDYGN
ncbi:MAG: lysophospholipid acyltransferase family protein [Chitinophagaceae bacterium]